MNRASGASPRDAAPFAESRAGLVVILGLSAGLNFLELGRQSFWLDEIYSYHFATLPWHEFWETMAGGNANMALYYLMLRAWIVPADTEFWIRSLSALMALASVAAVYALTTRLFGRRAGLLAAFLLAINPFVVAYAQEARAYALFLFLAICATALFVRALECSRIRDWVAYVVVASLAVYSHLFAGLLLCAHGVSLFFWPPAELPRRRLLAAAAGIGVLVIPIAVVASSSEGKLGWVSQPGLRQLAGVFATLAGSKWLLVPYAALSSMAVVVAIRERAAPTQRRTWYCAVLVAALVLPVGFAFAVSFVKPVFVDRFFISGVAPFVMLAASGLARIRSTAVAAAVLIAIAGLTIPRLAVHYGSEKENWRGVIAHLAAHARDDDAVLFYTATGQHAYTYYRRQQRAEAPAPTIAAPSRAMRSAEGLELRRGFVQELARTHSRVWLVLSHVDIGERPVIKRSIEDALGQVFRSATEWRFQGVRVLVYHSDAPAPH